jgi:hypothetical protein
MHLANEEFHFWPQFEFNCAPFFSFRRGPQLLSGQDGLCPSLSTTAVLAGCPIRRRLSRRSKFICEKARSSGPERRISRWEHEAVLEAVQARLDRNPDKMRLRRQTVEHPFGTIKSWMGSTHFQMRTLKHVSTEMALHVLAYNMKRLISILGVGGLIEAIRI